MITKTAIAAMALTCSFAGTAFAAEPTLTPRMATGHVNQSPGIATVGETANQIRASTAIGASVRARDGKEVAMIADLIVDPRQDNVDLAVLEPAGGITFKSGQSTVAWKSLSFQPTPTPRFVTALSRQALSSGISSKQQARGNSTYYDIKADLLGKKAVGPHGDALGTINNLVFNIGSGRLVALVLDTGGLLGVGAKDHAIAWNKAQPQGKNPVHLALSKAQVDAAPVITSMAPQPAPAHPKNAVPVIIHRDRAGNLSGTSILGPATNR
jgi:sporulation protein YlmC with PRC-barrel domain